MSHDKASHIPGVLALSFFFGTNLVVSRFALGQLHPLVYGAVRMPVAAGLAVIWTLWRYKRLPRGRQIWLHGAVVGVFATAAPIACFITSLQFQSSGVTSLFITLTPIATMLFAHALLKDDRLTYRKILGAVVSFAGVGLLVITGETGLGETRWEGFVLVLAGVACQGFGIVHVRKHLATERVLDITTVRLVVATVILIPLAWLIAGFDFSRLEWTGVLALVYGTLPGTFVGFLLYSSLAARFGPSKATQTEYLVPVVTVAAGVVFLGEQFTLIVAIGAALALSGVVIATLRSRKPV